MEKLVSVSQSEEAIILHSAQGDVSLPLSQVSSSEELLAAIYKLSLKRWFVAAMIQPVVDIACERWGIDHPYSKPGEQ